MTYFLKTSAKVLFAALALTSSAKAIDQDVEYNIVNAVYIDCKDKNSQSPRIRYFDNNGVVKHQSNCLDGGCSSVSLDTAVVTDLKKTYTLWCHDDAFELDQLLFEKKSQVSYKGGCQAAQCEAIKKSIGSKYNISLSN